MLGDGTKKNFKAMLAEARLPERTVELCLRGDLVAAHEKAESELEQAQQQTGNSLAGNGVGEIVDRIEALEAEMRDSTVTITLRGLTRAAWRELLAAHPPRRDEATNEIIDDDRALDLNVETFYDDLIRHSIVDPALDAEDWVALFATITDRQFGNLAGAAWLLNRGDIDIPFSLAASRAKRGIAGE